MVMEAFYREDDHKKATIDRVMRVLETYEDNEKALLTIERDRQASSGNKQRVEDVAVVRHNSEHDRKRYRKRQLKQYGGRQCRSCGRSHPPQKCPTTGRVCKMNHLARVCTLKQKHNVRVVQEEIPGYKRFDPRRNVSHENNW